jgi:hypothetical protein
MNQPAASDAAEIATACHGSSGITAGSIRKVEAWK